MVDDMLYRHTHDADDRVCLPVDSATPAPQIRKLQRHTLSLSPSLRPLCPNSANSVKSFSCLLSTCPLNLTSHRRATPPRRKPVVSPPHLTHHPRNFRQPNQRPSPPNLASHSKHGVRAAKLTPIRQQEPQFPQ